VLPPDTGAEEIEDLEEGGDKPSGSSRLVIYLVMGSLLILFVPLYFSATTIRTINVQVKASLEALQATLSSTPPVDPRLESLSSTLSVVQVQSNALQSISSTLEAIHISWPQIMAVISSFNPGQMSVDAVSQSDKTITISGTANEETVVMAYAEMLRQSGFFDPVAVEAISLRILPTLTPAPEPTLAPDMPTPTPATLSPSKVADFTISVVVKKGESQDG
jgi:hypothetical protein